MLLAIDVGNTNISCAIFEGEKMMANFRMTTKMQRTSDEYGMLIYNLIGNNKLKPEEIDAIIVASVVPKVMYSLGSALIKYFEIRPIVIEPGVKTGIRIEYDNPKQVGADRIVDAVAAYEMYGGPVLVIDYGTATTYDVITEDGSFIGGVTAPGIQISAQALWDTAAKLPEIEIKKPKSILAKDTVSSMQAGIVYGQVGQTEAIIYQLKKETGIENMKTVATGGMGSLIAAETDSIDIYNPTLTMHGLRIIYDKQKKNTGR